MKTGYLTPKLWLAATLLACGMTLISGCNLSRPDEKAAVTSELASDDFGTIGVEQDRDKGTITLRGDVAYPADKDRAEHIAQRAAPDYTIVNEIGVRPPTVPAAASADAHLDSAIEDNFKASVKAHHNLEDQSIHGSSKNGTLVIKGSVKTPQQKDEVESLAKQVPNVQQVVNELQVKPNKHSTPSS